MRACLFDMDGVLLDSEPFWRKAEVEVFGGVGLALTEEDCLETMGLGIREVVAYRHAQRPWPEPSCEEVAERIVDRVVDLVRREGEPLPGVLEAIDFLVARRVPLALATSSSPRLIEAVLEVLGLARSFPVVHSAMEEDYGKPHPAVFLSAARRLGVPPTDCLVVEDSVNGVIAAKAARMTVVAVPEAAMAADARFVLADHRLDTLRDFPSLWEELARPR